MFERDRWAIRELVKALRSNVFYNVALVIFASMGCLLWAPVFTPAVESAFLPMFMVGAIFTVLGAIAEYRKKVGRRVSVLLALLVMVTVVAFVASLLKGMVDPFLFLIVFSLTVLGFATKICMR